MTRDEIVMRFCALQAEVWRAVIDSMHPCDCFCGKDGFWDNPAYNDAEFRNDGKALEWIEGVVRDALEIEVMAQEMRAS